MGNAIAGEVLDGDVVALIVGQTVERRLTIGVCNAFVHVLLDLI